MLQSAFSGDPGLSGRLSNGGFALRVTGEIGASYQVQTSTNLPAVPWLDLMSFTSDRPATTILDTTATHFPRRFYRVRQQGP